MKALILAAGRGKRINELSQKKNKCMIKIKGNPLIKYSLDNAILANVSEIVIVVGYKAKDIMGYCGNDYNQRTIRYVHQFHQKGLVHAIECAHREIGKEDFLLMLGDELMEQPKHLEMMKKYNNESIFAICGVVKVRNKNLIKKTYAIIPGENDKILRLIEKPLRPINNIMGTGNCVFKNKIFSYIPQTPINQKRGEKELPDLIQCAINQGEIVKSFVICDKYFNLNFINDARKARRYFAYYTPQKS